MSGRFIIICLLFLCHSAYAQFRISDNKRYLLKDGKPFFWLGDTGWELFHRLNREEADRYLKTRSEQGFTVVQAVALAEMDGMRVPNANGDIPFFDQDLDKPNEKYFAHMDYIIDRADYYHITIGLLPTWGDKVFADRWGKGPEIFNSQNAATYASWLANRYKDRTNIIWILGGDRIPRGENDLAIWRSMGNAIKKATNNKAIISFHPQPNQLGSAEWFHQDGWLDFNMFQTGHCRETAVYEKIQAVYNKRPTKPVMDAEPIYEDHPVCFNVNDLGTSNAYDVRRSAYLDLFAGAFGHTYGCHDVWQMYSPRYEGVNGPHMYWYDALALPGARQMVFVRRLLEAYPLLDRVPDQGLIQENALTPGERIQATRGADYLFVYSSVGRSFIVNLGKTKGKTLQAYWYDPRNGKTRDLEPFTNTGKRKFSPPTAGYGQDWILVIDDAAKSYVKPGETINQ